jgi:hypothetical protein
VEDVAGTVAATVVFEAAVAARKNETRGLGAALRAARTPVRTELTAIKTNTNLNTTYIHLTSEEELAVHTRIQNALTPLVMSTYSEAYQKTLHRLSGLAATTKRAQMFKVVAEELDWGPRTQGTYWGAMCTLVRIAGLPWTAEDRAWGSQVEALVAMAPTWDLTSETEFLTTEMICSLTTAAKAELYTMRDPEAEITSAFVAMMLGQRLGDVLKLQTANIVGVGNEKLTVKFVDTKTSRKKGAYTLALPVRSDTAQLLLKARSSARLQQQQFIFATTENEIHKKLLLILGVRIDLRALRRIGLSRLASSGCPLTTLLQISRHSSIQMLERYLNSGMFHGEQHQNQMNALTTAWNHNLPTTW